MKKRVFLLLMVGFVLLSGMVLTGCGKESYTLTDKTSSDIKAGYELLFDNGKFNEGKLNLKIKKNSDVTMYIVLKNGYTTDEENFSFTAISTAWFELSDSQKDLLRQEYEKFEDEGLTESEIFETKTFKKYKPYDSTYTIGRIEGSDDISAIDVTIKKVDGNIGFLVDGIKEDILDVAFDMPKHMIGKYEFSFNSEEYKKLESKTNETKVHKNMDTVLKIRPIDKSYKVPSIVRYIEKEKISESLKEFPYRNVKTEMRATGLLEVKIEPLSNELGENIKGTRAKRDIYGRDIEDSDGAKTFDVYFPGDMVISLAEYDSDLFHESIKANTYTCQYDGADLFEITSAYKSKTGEFLIPPGNFGGQGHIMYEEENYYFKVKDPGYVPSKGLYADEEDSWMQVSTKSPNNLELKVHDMNGNEIADAIVHETKIDDYNYYYIKAEHVNQDLIIVNHSWEVRKIIGGSGDEGDVVTEYPIAYVKNNSQAKTMGKSDVSVGGITLNYNKIFLKDSSFEIGVQNFLWYDLNSIEIAIKNPDGEILKTLKVSELDQTNTEEFEKTSETSMYFRFLNIDLSVEELTGCTFEIKKIEKKGNRVVVDTKRAENLEIEYRVISEEQLKNNTIGKFVKATGNIIIENLKSTEILEIKVSPLKNKWIKILDEDGEYAGHVGTGSSIEDEYDENAVSLLVEGESFLEIKGAINLYLIETE